MKKFTMQYLFERTAFRDITFTDIFSAVQIKLFFSI
jgi:hypothetical protein